MENGYKSSILPGSNMGASIIALATHNKYSLHLPFYCQIKKFERIGADFQQWLAEMLRRLPTLRTSEGYLSLMPGIFHLTAEHRGSKNVHL